MTAKINNNKQIIWESKTEQIWPIVICFLFVLGAIWVKDEYSPLMFWATIIFFGGGGLFMLIRLINPRNIFVTPDTELGKQILSDQFQKDQQDLGFFTYTETGFYLLEHKGRTHFDWVDIETIFGFKEDRYTTDEICMDIFFNTKSSIRLTESTPGWFQFNKRLSKAMPIIPENWEVEIAQPPFVTNLTLLFDKENRSKEQAEKECYVD